MIQYQKDWLIENKTDDAVSLSLIQEGLDERIVPRIGTKIKSKEACNILEITYNERGSDTDQHQDES
jgi:hypothetical protein